MMVTDDELELPLVVADSAQELADIIGRNVNTIYSGISHEQHGRIKRSIYKKVEIKEWKKRKKKRNRKKVSRTSSRERLKM
jgi:hypothetical protein